MPSSAFVRHPFLTDESFVVTADTRDSHDILPQIKGRNLLMSPLEILDLYPSEKDLNMAEIPGIEQILEFVEQHKDGKLESTGYRKVTYIGDLYNVSGSTQDPKPEKDGKRYTSWKQMLIDNKIASSHSQCYVNNSTGGKHPKFSLGGHVTPNPNGSVLSGKSCYLMPMCSWHNSKARDGHSFEHDNHQEMLLLEGYLLGEHAATFQLRLPSQDPYAILYYSEEGWKHKNLSEQQAAHVKSEVLHEIVDLQSSTYILFERTRQITTVHRIKEVNLSY